MKSCELIALPQQMTSNRWLMLRWLLKWQKLWTEAHEPQKIFMSCFRSSTNISLQNNPRLVALNGYLQAACFNRIYLFMTPVSTVPKLLKEMLSVVFRAGSYFMCLSMEGKSSQQRRQKLQELIAAGFQWSTAFTVRGVWFDGSWNRYFIGLLFAQIDKPFWKSLSFCMQLDCKVTDKGTSDLIYFLSDERISSFLFAKSHGVGRWETKAPGAAIL